MALLSDTKLGRVFFILIVMLASLKSGKAQPATDQVVQAADRFLSTLSEAQRQKVEYAFDDSQQRARWSNFPTGFVPRGGISLKQMSAAQQAAALELMKTVLSPMGYEKVNQIRMADDDFKANGLKRGPRGGGPPPGNGAPRAGGQSPPPGCSPPPGAQGNRGGPPPFAAGDMFGGDLYYISFLGKPSATQPWMLQFGGHHLALNITQSLDAKQRQQAILNYRVADLVFGPGQDGKKIAPEGLKVSAMNDRQRTMLLDLMAEWAGIMNESAAAARMTQLKADLNETWLAWSDPTSFEPGTNITAYYRIQGPHLVIEYAPQHDEPTNHVHTIYRDPTNDCGVLFNGAE